MWLNSNLTTGMARPHYQWGIARYLNKGGSVLPIHNVLWSMQLTGLCWLFFTQYYYRHTHSTMLVGGLYILWCVCVCIQERNNNISHCLVHAVLAKFESVFPLVLSL